MLTRIRELFAVLSRLGILVSIVLTSAGATPIAIGLVSFDELIPGAPGEGVNYVSILNLTGDPGTGGWAIEPDFPVYSMIEFRDLKLTVSIGGSTADYSLPNLMPGAMEPLVELQFVNDTAVEFVTLTGKVNSKSLQIGTKGPVDVHSDVFIATIWPMAGVSLSPGADLAVLYVSPASTGIPEPTTAPLIAIAFAASFFAIRCRVPAGHV